MTELELLLKLRQRGASRLKRVAYRRNRSTLWSLTQNGTSLNVHRAYRNAPDEVVDAFARIVSAQRRTSGYYAATKTVQEWEGVLDGLRIEWDRHRKNRRDSRRSGPKCAGTREERAQLRELYARLNFEYFDNELPNDIPLRLSSRMRSRLGHVVPREVDGVRTIEELALNRRLMCGDNERVCEETLLHEMAHIAAYLFDNDAGHGDAWKRWARRVGCNPRACVTLRLA